MIICEMFKILNKFINTKYYLLVIDCFSSKIFTVPLKTKDSKTVAAAFEDIFKAFKAKIYEIHFL